jgi:hypothetical protein
MREHSSKSRRLTQAVRLAQRYRMTLEMRQLCERCRLPLPADGDQARICSYECTFCEPCAAAMAHACPNCGGELVRRPRRVKRT